MQLSNVGCLSKPARYSGTYPGMEPSMTVYLVLVSIKYSRGDANWQGLMKNCLGLRVRQEAAVHNPLTISPITLRVIVDFFQFIILRISFSTPYLEVVYLY